MADLNHIARQRDHVTQGVWRGGGVVSYDICWIRLLELFYGVINDD